MIFYMATEPNANIFDFLDEDYIFTKNTYMNLQASDILNIIKQELRNTEIEALIVDVHILKDGNYHSEEMCEAFKAFKILNPDSKIVIAAESLTDEDKTSNPVYSVIQYSEHLQQEIMELLSTATVVEREEAIDFTEIQNKLTEEIDVAIQNQKEVVETNNKSDIRAVEENIPQEIEPLKPAVAVPVIDVSSKANEKVKTSAGKPLLSQKALQMRDSEVTHKLTTLNEVTEKKVIRRQWECENVIVAFLGTEQRTGTTTTAFHAAEWLCDSGAKVSYTEANQHYHLKKIMEYLHISKVTDHYSRKNIEYFENAAFDMENGSNFILLDLGSIKENTNWVMQIIKEVVDQVVLVAGGKSYEAEALKTALEVLNNIQKPCSVVFNFLSELQFIELEKRYKDKFVVVNGSYEPELLKADKELGKILRE